MPLVVTAGVPILIPLVTWGPWVSKGIPFFIDSYGGAVERLLRVFSGNTFGS